MPDGDLPLDALAGVAALSRFHLGHSFRALTGEGAAVAHIARARGYANRQSVERAFRRAFGVTLPHARGGRRMLTPPSQPE